jgi:hypothetical protein
MGVFDEFFSEAGHIIRRGTGLKLRKTRGRAMKYQVAAMVAVLLGIVRLKI